MRLYRSGNSLAVRLPATVVKSLRLKEGDDIEIRVSATGTFEVERAGSARESLARLRKYRGKLPAGFKFDRLKVNEQR
jgi:antitoxin MazE